MDHGLLKLTLRIILFLLLGAIINIAVAWGLAIVPDTYLVRESSLRSDIFFHNDQFITTAEMHRGIIELSQFRKPPTALYLSAVLGEGDAIWTQLPIWSHVRPGVLVQLVGEEGWPDGVDSFSERATGWPRLSFRYWKLGKANAAWGYDTLRSVGLITLPDSWKWTTRAFDQSHRDLPYLPIWPGFAINTFFYTAILWLLCAAPFALRRRRRIKRNLCPACAYPVGSSDVCTECGKPVKA